MRQREPESIEKASATASGALGSVLALGLETHRCTVCLLEPINGEYRLAARLTTPAKLQDSATNQVKELVQRLGKRLRRRLWDDQRDAPLVAATDPHRTPPIQHLSLAASPRPRLRVWIAGLTHSNSLAAANGAVDASQAQLVGGTVLSASLDHDALAREFGALRPEALVISGGFDTTEPQNIRSLHTLTRHIAAALHQLPFEARPHILFAGNSHAYQHVNKLLESVSVAAVRQVDNVTPNAVHARINALSRAIDELYAQKCRRMHDFTTLEGWQTDDLPFISVESSFARFAQLWVQLNDIPELYAVYAGNDRWLHVWADAQTDRVLARFTPPGEPTVIESWRPPLRLLSGPWPEGKALPASVRWRDKLGIAPIVAAAARMSPQAAHDVLKADVFIHHE